MTVSTERDAASQKRPVNTNVLMALLGITIAALLIFTTLAVFFHYQAEDYRTAKYRAQYVLVDGVVGAIPSMNYAISEVLDVELDNGYRRSAAMYVKTTAESISASCEAVAVMYPTGDVKNLTFSSLSTAFARLAETAYEAYNQLTDPTPEIGSEVGAALSSSSDTAAAIAVLIVEGIDPETDWYRSPYDLLDGMDLGSIASLADGLYSAQP